MTAALLRAATGREPDGPAEAEAWDGDRLLAGFAAGTLAESRFHHRDHVQVAWLLLDRHPPLAAIDRFCSGLRRLAVAFGKAGLYHETITWAYLLLVHERRERLRLAGAAPPAGGGAAAAAGAGAGVAEGRATGAPDPAPAAARWQEFVERNPDLLTWKPSVLRAYYREETLASDLARQVFLLPDRGLPAAPPAQGAGTGAVTTPGRAPDAPPRHPPDS